MTTQTNDPKNTRHVHARPQEKSAMSTKSHDHKPVHAESKEKSAMSTKSHDHKPVHAASIETTREETTTMSTTPSTAAPTPAKPVTAAPDAGTATPTPLVFIAGPPATVSIPLVEYEPASPGEFKNVVPRAAERTALAQAVKDLAAFTTYQQTLGTSAPPYEEVVQAFTVGAQWTAMRTLASSWDGYSAVQQGLAWRALRRLMAQLVPVFTLAATANPKLLTQYPGLASLLGAKKSIAQKGVSTKKLNNQAIADGKAPVHGAVGKRRQRKAEKAAAAAQSAGGTAVATPAQPVIVAPTAAVTPAAAAAAPATAGPGAPVVAGSVNGVANGAGH